MAESVMNQIYTCLENKSNFLLSGGAGSGKTYSLIQTLNKIFEDNPQSKVACITYTNVATDEIKSRAPYTKLKVSTIHDFLWSEIKDYQKNLKISLIDLIDSEPQIIKYNKEVSLTPESLTTIKYKNYRNIENGVISHDDLIKLANYMFSKYPTLTKILCDKYDYIFIDEYQDTQKPVIEIFLNYIAPFSNGKLCIGFFGDQMQSIYDTGVQNIQTYIDSGLVNEIIKSDNYRCSIEVINLLNKIRTDIRQEPTATFSDGKIKNKKGKTLFVYSDSDFDLNTFIQQPIVSQWDFKNEKDTKLLFLTHKLIASELGFRELINLYKYPENLIGNEPDKLALHLQKIGGILFHYKKRNYSYVIDNMEYKINSNSDKKRTSDFLKKTINENQINIYDLINSFDSIGIVKKDDKLNSFINENNDLYLKISELPLDQAIAYYEYYNNHSLFSTQHGIKGTEFENVLVVMDNGRWNNYNFKYLFEGADKPTIVERTKRIFYVTCSRAMNDLIIFYPSPSNKVIEKAKFLFGEKNIISI